MPAIRLFEFDRRIPISEIVDSTSLWSTRAKGRSLYSRVSTLPEYERQAEIDALEKALRKRARPSGGTIIDFDNVETLGDIAGAILGLGWFPIVGSSKLARGIGEALRKISKIDRAILGVQERVKSSETGRDLDFLSRIARVATFRRDRV